ncbi:hypothetical protein BJY01DRAFT_228089 [Aspergillus pseudoustus]|uniref:Uncharacterized protein n=1 Tax=Aspergillus pseudoustus TaxID=1810923 RepID=A0ABR4IMV2_9EURO
MDLGMHSRFCSPACTLRRTRSPCCNYFTPKDVPLSTFLFLSRFGRDCGPHPIGRAICTVQLGFGLLRLFWIFYW